MASAYGKESGGGDEDYGGCADAACVGITPPGKRSPASEKAKVLGFSGSLNSADPADFADDGLEAAPAVGFGVFVVC